MSIRSFRFHSLVFKSVLATSATGVMACASGDTLRQGDEVDATGFSSPNTSSTNSLSNPTTMSSDQLAQEPMSTTTQTGDTDQTSTSTDDSTNVTTQEPATSDETTSANDQPESDDMMSSTSGDSDHPTDPNLSVQPLNGGQQGYASRFWDCCKPHCAWPDNTDNNPMKTCNQQDQTINNPDESSACDGGNAHVCHNLAPWAVNENVAYGYAATPAQGDICGKCYQLEFTGEGQYGANKGSDAIRGKTMIVQAINIGHDVAGGQFDLLIPGGGVGTFNACASQWGVSNEELGEQYGGFLGKCNNQLGYDAGLEAYKQCVLEQCQSVFGSRGLSDLEAGCHFFVDWMQAADNPKVRYQEVQCPSELQNLSGLH